MTSDPLRLSAENVSDRSNVEPCCEYGPPGHTRQQHHDASACYDLDCPMEHPHGGPYAGEAL